MSFGPDRSRKSLALQALHLRNLRWPGSRVLVPGGKRLEFHFEVSPFPGARTYGCLVTLDRLGIAPEAYVHSPDLSELADGKPLPHIYKQARRSTKLCLHLPGSGEWSANKLLAETYVAWTIEWLRFFELWLFDGEWRGGGKHPGE